MNNNPIRRSFLAAGFSLILSALACAQAPAPATPGTAASPPAAINPPSGNEALIRFEVISLPPLAARKALLKYPKEPALYHWLDDELEKKDSGVVLEKMHVLRVRGGQRSKVESVNEHAYPTEFDPPQIPQTFGGNGAIVKNGSSFPVTPTTPSSFTIRNLGFTCEAELTIGGKTVDLNLAPEVVRLAALMSHGIKGDVPQPVFETQRMNSQVLCTLGEPALVSTLSPPTGTGAPGGNKVDRVWLLFVTVTFPG